MHLHGVGPFLLDLRSPPVSLMALLDSIIFRLLEVPIASITIIKILSLETLSTSGIHAIMLLFVSRLITRGHGFYTGKSFHAREYDPRSLIDAFLIS